MPTRTTPPGPVRSSAGATTRTAAKATRGNTGMRATTSTPSRGFDDDEGPGRQGERAPGAARGAAVSGRTGPRSSAARARAGGSGQRGEKAVPDGLADLGARRAAWPRRPGWAAAAEGVPGRRARHDPCAADRRTADRAVMSDIEERSRGAWRPSPGAVPGSAAAGPRGPDHRRRGGLAAYLQPHRRGPRIRRSRP